MASKEAFAVIRGAIEANEKKLSGDQYKALALAALIIVEETLQDFKRIAAAIELLARRD